MKGKFIAFIFILMMLLGAELMFIFPCDTESLAAEKREAAAMPEFTCEQILDGSFMSRIEAYLNDRIAYRGAFMTAAAKIRESMGRSSELGKVIPITKQDWYGEAYESYLIYHDNKIMEVFEKKDDAQEAYIEALNLYEEKLSDSVNLYSIIVPTQLEFEAPVYSNFQDSQKSTIDEIYEKLGERYNCIDVYGAMQRCAGEYIYFKTDHHWTADGAYAAYLEFCSAAGLAPVQKSDCEKKEYPDILGSLYDFTKEEELKKNVDTLVWYDTDPDNKIEITAGAERNGSFETYKGVLFDEDISKMQYAAFAGGDNPVITAKNKECDNKRTLLILKDSYANAFFPWIVKNYSTVIMIDPRSCTKTLSDIIAEYKIDDFLVFNYVFLTSFDDYCRTLEDFAR